MVKRIAIGLALACSILVSTVTSTASVKAGYSGISGDPFICRFSNTKSGIAYHMNTNKTSKAVLCVKIAGEPAKYAALKKSKGVLKSKKYKVSNIMSYAYRDNRNRIIRCKDDSCGYSNEVSTEIPFLYKMNDKKTKVAIVGKPNYSSAKVKIEVVNDETEGPVSSTTLSVRKGRKFTTTLKADGVPTFISIKDTSSNIEWMYEGLKSKTGSNLTAGTIVVNRR